MPASGKPKVDWKTYRLAAENVGLRAFAVRACAFTPDSHSVVLLYFNDHLLSEKPWKDVYTTHLGVWDFKTGKVEEKRTWEYVSNNQGDDFPFQRRYMKYTADGRYLVILDADAIRVLDAETFVEVKDIAVATPKESPHDWTIVQDFGPGFSLTPDGARAAVAFTSSHSRAGGFVRVYDLGSGQIVREWRLRDGVVYVTGVALSSDGQRIAVSSPPTWRSSAPETFIPSGGDNVRVMDVKTGETIIEVNTKYVSGPVLFGPDDTLLTASISDDRKGYSLDTVKIWDARTGKLLREITNPPAGVHYRLDLSADGKLLLGYTGTEKPLENFVYIDSQQFQIWDFASGKEIAASPKFPLSKLFQAQLQLSPDQKSVVVWWGVSLPNVLVYEIPQH
jgi:WD40 repeat protein